MNEIILKSPNLPQNTVKTVAIGEKFTETRDELQSLGFNCLLLKTNSALEPEISSHADLLLFHYDSENFILSEEQSAAADFLKSRGANILFENNIKSPYPNDVKLNALILDNRIICNNKYISKYISAKIANSKKQILNIKQGYSKCSICVINKSAIITEDNGIYTLLKKCQIDVLKIQPNKVYLSEKHFGFIGGASGKLAPDILYFNGNIEEHPNYGEISVFLKKHGIKSIYNKNRPLTDIGSILPITETVI